MIDEGLEVILKTGQYQFIVSAYLARAALNRRVAVLSQRRSVLKEVRKDLANAASLIDSCELKRHQFDWQIEKVEVLIAESQLDHQQSAYWLREAASERDSAARMLSQMPDYKSGEQRLCSLSSRLCEDH